MSENRIPPKGKPPLPTTGEVRIMGQSDGGLALTMSRGEGLCVRDWFAGMAMQQLCRWGTDEDISAIAGVCYRCADAMLAEREREVRDADA